MFANFVAIVANVLNTLVASNHHPSWAGEPWQQRDHDGKQARPFVDPTAAREEGRRSRRRPGNARRRNLLRLLTFCAIIRGENGATRVRAVARLVKSHFIAIGVRPPALVRSITFIIFGEATFTSIAAESVVGARHILHAHPSALLPDPNVIALAHHHEYGDDACRAGNRCQRPTASTAAPQAARQESHDAALHHHRDGAGREADERQSNGCHHSGHVE